VRNNGIRVRCQVSVSADYLIRLRGGVRCNLFVLRDREEGLMIVLLVGFISDVVVGYGASDGVQNASNTEQEREYVSYRVDWDCGGWWWW
jgi:hypothetical protein